MKIYEGIVEKDDVEFGYVKVRIFGKHSGDKSILPTEDLPNAKIVFAGESNIDGISYFRTICAGTWVICSFLDEHEQYPIVLGSVVKTVNKLPDFTKGFTDENGEYPSKLGTTISDEARAIYPNNRVLKTKKHLIEISDAEGAERINIVHDSGATIIFKANGDIDITATNININGSDDSAIAYTDMKEAFDLLKTELNNLVSAFNSHLHSITAFGPTTTTSVPGVPATADMTSAEVSTVKFP